MSLLLDKQQEIADRMLPKELNLKTLILALRARITALEATVAEQAEEIDTLNETLANIGTPQQLEQIIAPVELQQDENINLAQ